MFKFRKSTQTTQSTQTTKKQSASASTMLKVSPKASITKRVESFKEFISSKQDCTSLSYRAFIREFGKTDKNGFLNASKLDINKAITIACRELAEVAITNNAPSFFSADFNGDYLVLNKRNLKDVYKHFPELEDKAKATAVATTKQAKTAKEKLLDYISLNGKDFDLSAINEAIEALEFLRNLKSKPAIRKQATATATAKKATATVNFISSKHQQASATATATAEKAKLVATSKTAKPVKA